ncbi:bacteriophage protein [Ameyamaea chiangmaiensis NBRC 103196]|uniref:DNA circularization N-terminal domain-containing protein n=1 Tax=Ameyamaea chiangmaiensis TaxID=442969 RepID=A0A850P2V2_9PROT|nr:DNA circularization N-terminal domain-containing protein [Ameyamaea chiangmaiensis]MBS4075473.1 DNA circularization N-terminal domain-containing protein [Ameyamaea chiangmaiensis]NVN38995.1 DNA circularization N-terminal domain-containing protein [Ameyamaea chiangmaiensis]GBQ69638.1 bacteriophage protein [Ameyamaea chiangmaiensis NBRC 103196]
MSGSITRLAADYLQCSVNGVPFAVMGSAGNHGRKFAEHDYPWRDGVWIEDMGKRAQRYSVRGFLVGALALTRRNLLVDIAETSGTCLFVHPTLGALTGWMVDFSWRERDGMTGIVDIEFAFVEKADLLGSVVTQALTAAVEVATLAFNAAAADDYTTTTASSYDYGSSVTSAGAGVATAWAAGAVAAIGSPAAVAGSVAVVAGNNGRYANGNVSGTDSTATASTVLSGMAAALVSADAVVAELGDATNAASIAALVLALTEQVRAALCDPSQQIAALVTLTSFTPVVITSSAPIGGAIATVQTATAMLCRQAALLSIAVACSTYEPTSSDDAEALQQQVAALFDDEATIAADAGNTATFLAMRGVRAKVLADLSARASALPSLMTVTRNAGLPALLLAQQLYQDGSRAPDLIRRANPVHPAFMPTSFEALST